MSALSAKQVRSRDQEVMATRFSPVISCDVWSDATIQQTHHTLHRLSNHCSVQWCRAING